MTIDGDQPPAAPALTDAERGFVHGVAQHYKQTDNMRWEYGYVMGWLMICEPAERSATQLAADIGVSRDAVDHVSRLLATPGVLERRDDGDEYFLQLPENNWPKAVRYSLVKIPNFHAILQRGLAVLEGASPERRRRLVDLERLYRHLANEIPAIFDRYATQTAS